MGLFRADWGSGAPVKRQVVPELYSSMRDLDLLRSEAGEAFNQLLQTLDGLTEAQSWGILSCQPGEYLHAEGSILSNITHIAGGKFMFGSSAFRNLEYRWRDIVAKMDTFWPGLEGAKAMLLESHAYWMEAWSMETDLERPVKTPWNEAWPSWKAIWTVCQHDSYHAGQIQMLRSTVLPSDEPPPPEGDTWLEYCHEYSR